MDLDANLIGSYSFYLLGSPFFWPIIPLPSNAVSCLMGPLLVLKLASPGCTSCLYLKRYVRDPESVMAGGILYVSPGFFVYNIFFDHFHKAIIVFPLPLWAMDEHIYHRRRGILAATAFASCSVSYYLLVE